MVGPSPGRGLGEWSWYRGARRSSAGGDEPCPAGVSLAAARESVAARTATTRGGRARRRVETGSDLPAAQRRGGTVAPPRQVVVRRGDQTSPRSLGTLSRRRAISC